MGYQAVFSRLVTTATGSGANSKGTLDARSDADMSLTAASHALQFMLGVLPSFVSCVRV